MRIPSAGRIWAYIGIAVGLGISLAGNIAATHLDGAKPSSVDIAAAGVAPIAVFIAIEVLSRNPWPDQRRWTNIKWAFSMIVGPAAAIVSFIHLAELTMDGHETSDPVAWTVALLTPLMIDGLLVGCTAALLIPAQEAERPTPLAEEAPAPEALIEIMPLAAQAALEPATKPARRALPAMGLRARWLAEQWDDERALKEITAENPDRNEKAVRMVLYRWKQALDKR
jgi:hypothetical protein